jgi:hypothetical protein
VCPLREGKAQKGKREWPLVVPPTTLLNLLIFFVLVMAYGRGVSLIRYARNAQQHGDHRGRYHSKATAAGEEGATYFAIFGVVDDWRMVSNDLVSFFPVLRGNSKLLRRFQRR